MVAELILRLPLRACVSCLWHEALRVDPGFPSRLVAGALKVHVVPFLLNAQICCSIARSSLEPASFDLFNQGTSKLWLEIVGDKDPTRVCIGRREGFGSY